MIDLEENLYEKAEELLNNSDYCFGCEWYRKEHGEGSCRWSFDLTDHHCPLSGALNEMAEQIKEIENTLKGILK